MIKQKEQYTDLKLNNNTNKYNKQILNINNKKSANNWRLTDQMLEMMNNAWKNEQLRSSLVFYTISLNQISPLTLSLWCFETRGRLPPRIKWSSARKRSIQGHALRTTQCLFLSLWHKMNAQNILTERVFSKKYFLWMWDNETIRNLKLKHCFRDNCCIQTYWLKNKIIKYYY